MPFPEQTENSGSAVHVAGLVSRLLGELQAVIRRREWPVVICRWEEIPCQAKGGGAEHCMVGVHPGHGDAVEVRGMVLEPVD